MIEPDPRGDNGTWTHNQVDKNHGNAVQAGEAHGDVNVGTSTHNSRTTTISLPAVGVIIGVVMTLVIGLVVWKVVAADDPPADTSTAARDDATTTDVTTTPRTSTPARTTPAKEVRLQFKTGVDVDGDDTAAKRVEGATGKTDLYLSDFNLMYANGGGFADDRGPEQDARTRCTEAIESGQNSAPAALPASEGTQYCFVTSEGRVAWLRVKSATLSSYDAPPAVTLAVHVW
ncbi:hypothetical protein [Lentzea sp.]|uniref:hypothetical protein n=1 Tax=Lentzea sp. TaxID=56099 RepID=UPI002B9CBFE0|nr:hypothetical protein [Lentzea sp.]HUQ61620.1 hypothetical protein [Lentzea sp.]